MSSNTPAVALHGFAYSTNFEDMPLSRLAADMGRRRSPRATLSLPFALRTFVRSAGRNCAIGQKSFLGAGALSLQEPTSLPASVKELARRDETLIGRLEATTATPPRREPPGQRALDGTSP